MYKFIQYFILSSALYAAGTPFAVAADDCYITGCNSEICADIQEPQMGRCEWLPVYACYHQYGVCEKDANGVCGWVQTPELVECINKLQQELSGSQF